MTKSADTDIATRAERKTTVDGFINRLQDQIEEGEEQMQSLRRKGRVLASIAMVSAFLVSALLAILAVYS